MPVLPAERKGMGFFRWLFGKQKKDEKDAQEEWEKQVCRRDQINVHDETERTRYLTGCMEQLGEAEKELKLLTGEYSLVTSYLKDMEEIESLPPEQAEEVRMVAGKMLTLEKERQRYQDKEDRMPDSDYRRMRAQEQETEEGIAKLKEAEQYQKLVKQDLAKLDGERHAYGYRKGELRTMLVNLRGMALICLGALAFCILMLLVLQFGFSMDTAVGYYISVGAAAVAITVLYLKYTDAERELLRVEKTQNRLIQLQNTVKIRYINNSNLLDYLYLKYEVDSAEKLKQLWKLYQAEKEERRQYAEAEANYDYNRKQLSALLSRYRVQDPDRFVLRPAALVDTREMIELRHELIVRRQTLRKQMEYNQELADTAQKEIRELAAQYPQYVGEIRDLLEKAENSLISEMG